MKKLQRIAVAICLCGVSAPALAQTSGNSSASAASVQISAANVVKANVTVAPVSGSAPAAYDNTNGATATANTSVLANGLLGNAYSLLNIGAATSEAKSSTGTLTSTTGTTTLTNVSSVLETVLLILPSIDLGISANALTSTTTAGIDGNGNFYSTGSSNITNFGLTGNLLSGLNLNLSALANAAPNTVVLNLAGLKLTLNEQLVSSTSNSILAQTNAIDLALDQYSYNGALLSGNVILGHSQASISAVPEPAAWMSMMLGFGFVGMMLRKRGQADRNGTLRAA